MHSWKKIFAIIWTGQLFSTLSSSIVGYAVMFWLSITTRSAEVLAFSIIAALLPQLVLGVFTGVLIDRWNRRITMIFADLFIAACTGVIAVLFYMGKVDLFYIYLLLALRSVGAAFHIPAMQASIPLLAPEDKLMQVAGINNVIQALGTIGGPVLAALLITLMDMTWVLMIDVAGAVLASSSLLFVHIPNPDKKEGIQTKLLFEFMEGLKAIYQKPALLWMFILSIIATVFIMPVAALFPLMTLDHFLGSTYHMSVIEIAWGVGMLAGGGIMGLFKFNAYKVILIHLMYILLGLSFLFSGILPSTAFVYFAAITVFGGISMSIYSGAFTVVLQTMVDPAALGRVFSMYGSITLLPAMVGLLATGFIADAIGIVNAFIICGIAIGVIGVIAFFIPPVLKLVKDELKKLR